MKKWIIAIIMSSVVLAAVFYFTSRPESVDTTYYADYLPAGTLATVSLTDINELTDAFPASPLGQFLSKETMHGIFTDLGVEPGEVGKYDELHDGISGVMTSPAFRTVFGDDTVLALLPPDPVKLKEDPEAEMEKSLLVFATSATSGALDTFARLVMSSSVTTETVDGLKLTRIEVEEGEFVYGYTANGVILLSSGPQTIVTGVAVKNSGSSLQQAASFAGVKSFWQQISAPKAYTHWFLNVPELVPYVKESGEEDVRKLARYLSGVDYISSVLQKTEDGLKISLRTAYSYDALDPVIQGLYRTASKNNTSLDLITEKSLIYHWASTLNSAVIKEVLSVTDEEKYNQADEEIRQELGFSLERLLAAVGPQYGIVVNDIVNTGLFPLPKLVLFLEIRDREVAESVLERIRKIAVEKGVQGEQSSVVNGYTIYYWPILPGEATQPAIVLTDTMLYLANGKTALEAVLTGDRSRTELAGTVSEFMGSDIAALVTGANYSSLILLPEKLSHQLKGITDWLASLLATTGGVSVESLNREILQLMRALDLFVVSSNMDKEYADSEVIFRVTGAKAEN